MFEKKYFKKVKKRLDKHKELWYNKEVVAEKRWWKKWICTLKNEQCRVLVIHQKDEEQKR